MPRSPDQKKVLALPLVAVLQGPRNRSHVRQPPLMATPTAAPTIVITTTTITARLSPGRVLEGSNLADALGFDDDARRCSTKPIVPTAPHRRARSVRTAAAPDRLSRRPRYSYSITASTCTSACIREGTYRLEVLCSSFLCRTPRCSHKVSLPATSLGMSRSETTTSVLPAPTPAERQNMPPTQKWQEWSCSYQSGPFCPNV